MRSLELFADASASAAHGLRCHEPVTFAAPIAQGAIETVETLQVLDDSGTARPTQARVLDRWADGSIRWALVDFLADVRSSPSRWFLRDGVASEPAPADVRLDVTHAPHLRVRTGVADFDISEEGARPFSRIVVHGTDACEPLQSGLEILGHDGRPWDLAVTGATVEDHGSVRAVVRMDGWLSQGRMRCATVRLRMHFFAGLGTVKFELTLRNPRRAAHRNGHWDLGDAGSIRFREMRFRLASSVPGEISCSVEPHRPLVRAGERLELSQASSGGQHRTSPVHLTAERTIPTATVGYRLQTSDGEFAGDRATPIVSIHSAQSQITLAVPQFWQNFPKALRADPHSLSLELFPAATDSPYELQGGEQKTHIFFACFGADSVSELPLDWCRAPTRVRAAASAYADAGAIPPPSAMEHPRAPDYERLISAALDGGSSFVQKRERIDEYGWRHFGDLYADHESANYTGPPPVVSHYNNQYDPVAAFAAHFMRTGDWRWWDLMDDLARHVVDIDIYHTAEDRAAYNGGLFWHTNHYISADTATHRSFPRRSGLPGGGPSNEHNYTTGLLLHYYLTGSRQSAESVVGLAEWVLAMDDGAQSRFRWVDRGPTGLASSTRSFEYHGPGRGAGNSIRALVDAHRVSGERRYLNYAEHLIRRCIHPRDEPAAHDLLDAEHRWSYTVFLQVLLDYLQHKKDVGQRDGMWRYAKESLVAYAHWMAASERPYLEQADRLEFPNETWVAQDLRKADVLHRAARYVSGADRPAFFARRDFFFAYCVDTLLQTPKASYTRPLVLTLANGMAVAGGDVAGVDEPAEPPPADEIAPFVPFVPQKVRAVRRLAIGAIGGLALMLILLVWAFSSAYL